MAVGMGSRVQVRSQCGCEEEADGLEEEFRPIRDRQEGFGRCG